MPADRRNIQSVLAIVGVIAMDIAYLTATILFFAVTVGLVYGCEKLRGQS